MYKAVFFQDKSEYYCDDQLLFTVKRKRLLLGIRNVCKAYINNDLIFSFYSSEFAFLYWKLNILTQKLAKKISLKKDKNSYSLVLNQKSLTLRFTSNPFKKMIARIYLEEICICEIEKEEKKSKTYFNFIFSEKAELEYYALVLFSMYSVGITDSI